MIDSSNYNNNKLRQGDGHDAKREKKITETKNETKQTERERAEQRSSDQKTTATKNKSNQTIFEKKNI